MAVAVSPVNVLYILNFRRCRFRWPNCTDAIMKLHIFTKLSHWTRKNWFGLNLSSNYCAEPFSIGNSYTLLPLCTITGWRPVLLPCGFVHQIIQANRLFRWNLEIEFFRWFYECRIQFFSVCERNTTFRWLFNKCKDLTWLIAINI